MGLYTMTFTFMLSSLPCLHTFWHAIPTSCYIFLFFFILVYTIIISRGQPHQDHTCKANFKATANGTQSATNNHGACRRVYLATCLVSVANATIQSTMPMEGQGHSLLRGCITVPSSNCYLEHEWINCSSKIGLAGVRGDYLTLVIRFQVV